MDFGSLIDNLRELHYLKNQGAVTRPLVGYAINSLGIGTGVRAPNHLPKRG